MNKTGQGNVIVYIFAILAMLFWGLSFIWSKIVFEYWNPIATITIRLIISAFLLFLFLLIFDRKQLRIPKGKIKLFLLTAFFEPFLYFIGESFGLQRVDASITSVIISTIPVFTAIVGIYYFRERLSKLNLMGVFVSFTGVILMLLNQELRFSASLEGVMLLFLAVFSAIGYGIAIKKISEDYNPIFIIFVQNLIGFFYFLPLFLIFDLDCVIHTKINFELASSVLMLSVLGSSLAFIFYINSIRKIGIAKANVFTNLIPIFTAIAAFFILGEQFTYIKSTGMLLAIMGVYLTQRKKLTK
jgi:drug/metabolite transporter (DMT)-like permease